MSVCVFASVCFGQAEGLRVESQEYDLSTGVTELLVYCCISCGLMQGIGYSSCWNGHDG